MAGGEDRRENAGPDPTAEAHERALSLAFRHLSRRDRTEMEIRRHLDGRGVRADVVAGVIEQLRTDGYLDDEAYAQRFTEDRRRLDGWGSERIGQALARHGIPGELIAAAVGTRDHAGELDAAIALLRRRLGRPPADERERARALGLLLRRGYDLELAHDAVRRVEV